MCQISCFPDMDIRSIAQAIGYEDAGYFSRVFKNELGTTPSEWSRKDNRVDFSKLSEF